MLGRESDSCSALARGTVFFRIKKSGERSYLQIVENKREGAAVRQTVIANLGRVDELAASGALASLLVTAKLTDEVLLINALAEDVTGALSPRPNASPVPCCLAKSGSGWGSATSSRIC